jgi:hypothetical protein
VLQSVPNELSARKVLCPLWHVLGFKQQEGMITLLALTLSAFHTCVKANWSGLAMSRDQRVQGLPNTCKGLPSIMVWYNPLLVQTAYSVTVYVTKAVKPQTDIRGTAVWIRQAVNYPTEMRDKLPRGRNYLYNSSRSGSVWGGSMPGYPSFLTAYLHPFQTAVRPHEKYFKGRLPFEDVDDVQLPSWGQQMPNIVQELILLFQREVVESKGDQDYVIFWGGILQVAMSKNLLHRTMGAHEKPSMMAMPLQPLTGVLT